MQDDRYATNKSLYIVGMLCLVGAMGLGMFSFFLIPHLFWNLHYNIPEFIMDWAAYLQEEWVWTASGASWALFLLFFVPALILGWVSYWASNRLENELPTIVSGEAEPERPAGVDFGMQLLKPVAIIAGVLFFFFVMRWMFFE